MNKTDYWASSLFKRIYWRLNKANSRSKYPKPSKTILQQALNEYKQTLKQEPDEQPQQYYHVSGIDKPLTQKEYLEYKKNNPLQFGKLKGNIQHGILTPNYNIMPLPKPKKKKPLYDI